MLSGTMTVGVVRSFFHVYQSGGRASDGSVLYGQFSAVRAASAKRTFELLDEEEEFRIPLFLWRWNGQRRDRFEHVSFGYEPDHLLMKDISFTAKPGQKIAVVGSTGAGKTTLVNL